MTTDVTPKFEPITSKRYWGDNSLVLGVQRVGTKKSKSKFPAWRLRINTGAYRDMGMPDRVDLAIDVSNQLIKVIPGGLTFSSKSRRKGASESALISAQELRVMPVGKYVKIADCIYKFQEKSESVDDL
jgi:hypothetical protein